MNLVLEDRTKVLRRGFFDVQNRVGVGRDEEDYHQAMVLWLDENRVPHMSKPPHPLMLYGQVAHKLFPDFVAWDQITIEMKAIPRNPGNTEFVQLFDYLKCRGDPLGLLVNMGLDRVHVDRIVYEQKPTRLEEDWNYWSGHIDGQAREVGILVREALRDIYQEHTTGYGDEVVRKLIVFALSHHGLTIIESPVAKASYGDVVLRESPLDCLNA
jgi:GxxExxY protein